PGLEAAEGERVGGPAPSAGGSANEASADRRPDLLEGGEGSGQRLRFRRQQLRPETGGVRGLRESGGAPRPLLAGHQCFTPHAWVIEDDTATPRPDPRGFRERCRAPAPRAQTPELRARLPTRRLRAG